MKNINETFLEKCRLANLKITPQRVLIYDELKKDKTHPTADQVYKKIRTKAPHISLDTVNRTLLSFAQIGLVEIVPAKDKCKRFDAGPKNHHHFQCTQCHRIVDFSEPIYDTLPLPKTILQNNQISSHQVILNGTCEHCLKPKTN